MILLVRSIWQGVLSVESLLNEDNYFDIGGDSFSADVICERIETELGKRVPIGYLYLNPSVELLSKKLVDELKPLAKKDTIIERKMTLRTYYENSTIAVIGIGCRLPGADDQYAFFENLEKNIVSAEFSSQKLNGNDENLVGVVYGFNGSKLFDHKFFGIGKSIANVTSPMWRVFLECCFHCLEDSGYIPKQLKDRVGMIVSCDVNFELMSAVYASSESSFGSQYNSQNISSGYIAYHLGLNGPCMNLQTACSSGLTVVSVGIKSILTGEMLENDFYSKPLNLVTLCSYRSKNEFPFYLHLFDHSLILHSKHYYYS